MTKEAMKKQEYGPWDYLEDTPEEFDAAIKMPCQTKNVSS